MKKTFSLLFVSLFGLTTFGQNINQVDSVSYLVGVNIGGSIAREMQEVNKDLLIRGLLDILNGKELMILDQT